MSKKIILVILAFVILAGAYRSRATPTPIKPSPAPANSVPSITIVNKAVTVTLNFGNKISTVSGLTAVNAFEALKQAAQKENLILVTKDYDFGTMVQKIGEYENLPDKAWIYYLNGESATQAANVQPVKSGDEVEWKYEKPAY